jgi:hypothetical protein
MNSQHRKAELEGSFKNGTETLEALPALKHDLTGLDIKMKVLKRAFWKFTPSKRHFVMVGVGKGIF